MGATLRESRPWVVAVAAGAVALLAVLPAPARAAPAAATGTDYAAGVGCPSGLRVAFPRSGGQLEASAAGVAAANPVLVKAAATHATWLRALTCRPRPGVTHLRTTGMSSGTASSSNWSGYLVYPSGVNLAQAEWVVPATGQPDGTAETDLSIWPGIGQGTSKTSDELIQDGTDEFTQCDIPGTGGTCKTYSFGVYFWLEMFPDEAEQEITNLTPSVGDQVAAIASYSSGTASFTLCDYTKNQCVDGNQASPAPPASTAEWILERPTYSSGGLANLADYGTDTLTNCAYGTSSSAYLSPISAGPSVTSITMATSHPLSTVSGLASGGAGFTGTWHAYQ